MGPRLGVLLLAPLVAMQLFAALALSFRVLGVGELDDLAQALIFGTIAIGPVSAALGLVRSFASA